MKAYLLYEAGGPEKLILSDIEKPILKSGEVLVQVKAIGLNPVDAMVHYSDEMTTRFLGEARPVILGWDIAGDIVEKAADTDGFEIGDAVFALLEQAKGYAEYVAVPATALAHKPSNISYEEAGAVPIAGLTAWQPLVRNMNIKKGDKVLIHAAAGGVGHYGIQIAKHLGAAVFATSSAGNRDFVLSLGADHHIDYTTVNFWEVLNDIDFVLDTVGGDTQEHSIEITKPGGTVVTVIPPLSEAMVAKAREKNVNLILCMEHTMEDLRTFADLMAKGIIKTHIAAVYPFEEMGEAHKQVEKRRTAGKIVVKL